jgi:hypothetical protein
MITPQVAARIADRDPDGWITQPTRQAYAEFRAWAVATYGAKAWKDYVEGNVRRGENPV